VGVRVGVGGLVCGCIACGVHGTWGARTNNRTPRAGCVGRAERERERESE